MDHPSSSPSDRLRRCFIITCYPHTCVHNIRIHYNIHVCKCITLEHVNSINIYTQRRLLESNIHRRAAVADDEWIDYVVVENNLTTWVYGVKCRRRRDLNWPSRAMCWRTARSNNYTSYTTHKLSRVPIPYVRRYVQKRFVLPEF